MTLAEAAARAEALAADGLTSGALAAPRPMGRRARSRAPVRVTFASGQSRSARSASSVTAEDRAVPPRARRRQPGRARSALLALESLSRDHPKVVNDVRPLLHQLATRDGNDAVRQLAVVSLRNGSTRPDTLRILDALAADDEAARNLRDAAGKVAQQLRRRASQR